MGAQSADALAKYCWYPDADHLPAEFSRNDFVTFFWLGHASRFHLSADHFQRGRLGCDNHAGVGPSDEKTNADPTGVSTGEASA